MQKNHLMAVAGGALLFLLGLVIGISVAGPDPDEIEAAVAGKIDAATAAQAERIGKLEAAVAALSTELGGRIDGLGGNLEARTQAVGDIGTRLGSDLASLGESLTSAIEASRAASLSALENGLAGLESGLAGLRGEVSSDPAAAPPEGVGDAGGGSTAAPAGISAGETAVLSDGALRVFVSRVDDEAGAAHLRANGTDLTLTVGQSEAVASAAGDCRLTLDALDRGHVAVSGACGDALPAPEGAAPGSMVTLADGLRVFVSGVTDTEARIAINGVATRTVPVGEEVEVRVGEQTCRVSVESVDRGRVALGYVCG